MKRLHLAIIVVIAITILLLVPLLANNSAKATCMPNWDWTAAPCYSLPGLNVTKAQMQKDWAGYYAYKGSQWMEMKRTEMTNQTTNGLLKAWICAGQSNYDVWQYYYLNGQAQSIAWPTNGPNCDIPPLQQLKVGEKIGEIECGYDRFLLVNKESGIPSCIKLANISKLLDLGWDHLATYLNDTVQHSPVTTIVSITGQDLPSCSMCQGKSENLTVIIGVNNTLRWINNTPISLSFFALPNSDDIAFSNSAIFPLVGHINTMKFPAYLYSGQSFEYTFTKSGKFFWHTTPQFMGWVTVLPPLSHPITYLNNDTGVVTLQNKIYYFETPNYAKTTNGYPAQILFHNVLFTLFPSESGGSVLGDCEGMHYMTDTKFPDGTRELLHVFVDSTCGYEDIPIKLSAHTNPPAGLAVYDGKMKLLASVENMGTLSGNVVLAGGPRPGPQANYEVDVYASNGITIVGKTLSDSDGNYSISLPAGNYTIYAPDYPSRQTHFVSIVSGKNTVLNIMYGIGYK